MIPEQRCQPAVPFDAPVVVKAGPRQVVARAAAISKNEMLIFPRSTLRMGETVSLHFPLLGRQTAVIGRVVREPKEQPSYACAVEFREVDAEVGRAIQSLMTRAPGPDLAKRPTRPSQESPDLLTLYQQALRQIDEEERDQRRPRRRSVAR